MSKYRPFQVNQKGVFSPWFILAFVGVLLVWLLFNGKFNSWLNLFYQDPKITTQQPVATVQPTTSASPISIPSPTPGVAKKE
ncbi:MAG: hypothetical protein Q7R43_01580, partial [Candidatus Daviesbacteria bacterium]|nr:hypothetical protein [Candidatus Daviesbacteria bacterium]